MINEADVAMAIVPIFDMYQAIIACGINDVNIFDEVTQYQKITFDIFNDDFSLCIHKTF